MGNCILLFYYDLSVHTCLSGQKLSENSAEKKNLAESWGKYPVVSKSVEVLLTKIESTGNSAWLW